MSPSTQVSVVQRDWGVGIVKDTQAPDPRAVQDHQNGFYEDDGSCYKRGPSVGKGTAHAAPASNPEVWIFDGYFDVGQRTVSATQSDFYVLDSDDTTPINLGSDGLSLPVPSAMLESLLFIGGGYIYGGSRKTADYTTGTISLTKATYDANGVCTNETAAKTVTGTGTTWNTLVDAGMLLQRGNERVYPIASVDSTTQITLRDPYDGATGSGINYTLTPFYKITAADPYEDGDWYASVANRLLTSSGNVLKFTEIGKPYKWTLTANALEIPNEHEFAEGARVTGAAGIGATAVVFTTGGIRTVDGMPFDIVDSQGNTNHRVKTLSRELISYGQYATWQQALVVPCESGIFLIDGVSAPQRISHPMDPLYQSYMERNVRPGQAAVYLNHFIVPFITAGGDVKDIFACRLDRPIKVSGQPAFPFSRIGGDGTACPAFAVRHLSSPAKPLLLGANKPLARIVDCSGFFFPDDAASQLDADGQPIEWVLVTRDYETGGGTKNDVRTIRPRYELVGDGTHIIEAEYGFGVQELGGYNWDEWDWADEAGDDPDDLYWEDDEDEAFYVLACEFGESDGLDPEHCRVNENTRLIRFRFRNRDTCSRLRWRSLEQFIRLAQSPRR